MQNAIKFTFPDGIIEIQAEEKNKKMYLTITDPGLGIPEDVLATLFQPSKESTRLGTAQEQGTGIGLSLVKDLVEANGGQIYITSQQGTVCTLIFPMMEWQKKRVWKSNFHTLFKISLFIYRLIYIWRS